MTPVAGGEELVQRLKQPGPAGELVHSRVVEDRRGVEPTVAQPGELADEDVARYDVPARLNDRRLPACRRP